MAEALWAACWPTRPCVIRHKVRGNVYDYGVYATSEKQWDVSLVSFQWCRSSVNDGCHRSMRLYPWAGKSRPLLVKANCTWDSLFILLQLQAACCIWIWSVDIVGKWGYLCQAKPIPRLQILVRRPAIRAFSRTVTGRRFVSILIFVTFVQCKALWWSSSLTLDCFQSLLYGVKVSEYKIFGT